jgi:DNA-directed RNA polymerase subunit RPC12/RpoP
MMITANIRCPKCGLDKAEAGPGKGPHAARWVCARCGRFLGWIDRRLWSDLHEYDPAQDPRWAEQR